MCFLFSGNVDEGRKGGGAGLMGMVGNLLGGKGGQDGKGGGMASLGELLNGVTVGKGGLGGKGGGVEKVEIWQAWVEC